MYIYIPPLQTTYHYTVQVALAQVEYVRQWVEGKRIPAQVATGGTTTDARSEQHSTTTTTTTEQDQHSTMQQSLQLA